MSENEAPSAASSRVVTMREVAREAGVSVSTVSLVINEKKDARIGEDARARVREAIARLGYRPNALAKNLVHGGSRFIGLVADSVATSPFAGQIIHGAQDEAWRNGYVLLVANTEGDATAEREALAMMLEHKVRGILYSTWYHRETSIPPSLTETDFVLVDCYAPGTAARTVVPDEMQGGCTATEMLLAAGHRRIAFINTETPSPARVRRLEGYLAALASAGIAYDPDLVLDAQPDQEGGYEAVATVLGLRATGVFCHNDRVAMGLYDGLRERGLKVPEDLSVVGFDNQEVIAAHLHPPLSTVALPHYELGVRGVRALLGPVGPQGPEEQVPCPPVVRNSTARVVDP